MLVIRSFTIARISLANFNNRPFIVAKVALGKEVAIGSGSVIVHGLQKFIQLKFVDIHRVKLHML